MGPVSSIYMHAPDSKREKRQKRTNKKCSNYFQMATLYRSPTQRIRSTTSTTSSFQETLALSHALVPWWHGTLAAGSGRSCDQETSPLPAHLGINTSSFPTSSTSFYITCQVYCPSIEPAEGVSKIHSGFELKVLLKQIGINWG